MMAMIMISKKIAKKYTDMPVYIAASAQTSGVLTDPEYMSTIIGETKFLSTLQYLEEATEQESVK